MVADRSGSETIRTEWQASPRTWSDSLPTGQASGVPHDYLWWVCLCRHVPVYALDAVDDAVGPTRSLVSGLGIGGWLKLGGVTLFVGGVGSVSFSANLPRLAARAAPSQLPVPSDPAEVTLTLGLVLTVLVGLAAVQLVRSLLEFVLYEALREDAVAVRRSLGRWWRHALELWVFRVVITWSLLAAGVGLVYGGDVGGLGVAAGASDTLVAATGAVFLGGYALVAGFTTRFVVPVMLASEAGVVGAWRRFLRVGLGNPGQYLAYLVVGPLVRFAADVLALSAAVLVAVLLAIPVAVFLVPAAVVVSAAPEFVLSPPLVLLSGGLSAGYVVAVLLGAVLARFPFVVYVRHYALSVLGGTAPSLDPLRHGRRRP